MVQISLKAARVNANMTQEQVAKHLHKGKQTITNWENGHTSIDAANFTALCKMYGMDEDNIFLPNKSNLKHDLSRNTGQSA